MTEHNVTQSTEATQKQKADALAEALRVILADGEVALSRPDYQRAKAALAAYEGEA